MLKVFYHAHCMDGYGASWAIWKKFGKIDAQYFPIGYETKLNTNGLHGADVMAVDFSFKADVVAELVKITRSLTIIDHHKTALEEVEKYKKFLRPDDLLLFDMQKSGAVLAWEYAYPSIQVPELLEYIQDRDLWVWKLPDSQAVSAWLMSQPISVPQDLDRFVAQFIGQKEQCTEIGKALVQSNEKFVDKIMLNAVEIDFCGHRTLAVQSPILMSEVGNTLLKRNPGFNVALIWYVDKDMVKFSLRGNGTVDLTEIAKPYGGGGHRSAAGFDMKTTNAKQVIESFLNKG